MKMINSVRGTMKTVDNIHVDVDTVYIRSNIKKIEEENFTGFEYDEIQYEIKEYISTLTTNQDSQTVAMLVLSLMAEVDTLKSRIDKLEGVV